MFDILVPPFAYVAFVHACVAARPRLPRVLGVVHNALLALYSACVAVGVGAHWIATARGPSVCGATTPLPAWILTTWYVSKMWEWGDTALLVSRGRRLERLHLVHHASTASLVALQTWDRASQTPLYEVGAFLNALVHTAMYAYFARPHSHLRRWVTRVQVAQHAVMCACLVRSVATTLPCERDASHNLIPLVLYAFFFAEFASLH